MDRTYHFIVDTAADHAVMTAGGPFDSTHVAVRAPDRVAADLAAAQMAYRHGIPVATRPLVNDYHEWDDLGGEAGGA
jgi:hypothetical protein